MAAHHAAQRQHQYSIPLPPPPSGPLNDELRLPSIKDLAFKYERPRQEGLQSVGSQPNSDFTVSSNQQRSRGHSQSWARSSHPAPPVPTPISTHHLQQQHTPPLSAGHDSSSAKSTEYSPRHDNGGYLTPGMPLSAQMTPPPGSISTGSVIRSDDHLQMQNKRPRPSSLMPIGAPPRDSRQNHVTYAPHYQSYQTSMSPPSPYHQMSPVLAAPPSIPHTPIPPSPHTQMHHQPTAPPPHPAYPYQQQPSYMPRSSPQLVAPHPPPSHLSNTAYHPAPPQHTQVPQIQAPPSSHPQAHHNVPYPSPSPSGSQEHQWEPHHHSQHPQPQPVHHIQHHPVQHAPPPPSTATPASLTIQHTQYSHPPPPPPTTIVHNHQPQSQPQHQPQHAIYAQPINPQISTSQHSLTRVPSLVTTPIVAAPEVEIRTPYPTNPAKPSARENTMSEIVKLCSILYDFASRYSSLSSALPHFQPSQTEVAEMARRANDVVHLLEVLRQIDGSEESSKDDDMTSAIPTSPDDHRPPKRPWEDMAQDGQVSGEDTSAMLQEPPSASIASGQTTAEQDMELIRSKRATTTAGSTTSSGQLKSKYRKRSRATPPGKCHSCNIRETPEWRRGPDGARTLCNACGLHYAKLMRKQAKLQNGEPPPKIDLDTLKASTKAAEAERNAKADENSAPGSTPQHHQGSFQIMSVMSPVETQSSSTASSDPSRLPAHHQTILPPPTGSGTMHPPPPPWAAANGPRAFTPSDQFQSLASLRKTKNRHISAFL
ncbi:hypothetical protein GGU10DRAFT_434588 [Lentinula aff. detonsa]|uniref:GATA-type domain-containing protein n=1 Tax=Lentinula aff. detonsa TaxID=2804958 RepID=A0AA38KPM6_9AGAR|nr:hypothetical protein GGU10DRAFT_434588 [Lentinula aff. detonsa]